MVDHTWVSDAADSASTAGAWNPASAPGAGDNIIFNSAHAGACTWDLAQAQGTFAVGAGSPAISIAASCSTNGLTTAASTTLTVATTKVLTVLLYSGYTYSHAGTIAGAGTGSVVFELHDAAFTWIPGTVTCPATLSLNAAAAASRTCSLGTNASFDSTLTVSSAHAANTITLNLAGCGVASSTIVVSTKGIILSSVTGATIDSGDITVSADGTLTEANITQIKTSGSVDLSAGTYTPSTARWIMTGLAKTLKLAAGHKIYDLITTGSSDLRLAANATVSNELVMCARINPLAFTLTHESPEKLYDQRRVHYEVLHEPTSRSVGRSDAILNYITGNRWGTN